MDPRDTSGGPGTIPGDPETFPMAETALIIYKSSPPDYSELLMTSGMSYGTPNNIRNHIKVFLITLASPNLKCVDPTGSGIMQT